MLSGVGCPRSSFIFKRLQLDPENYVRFIRREQQSRFHAVIGALESMRDAAKHLGRSFLKGQAAAAQLFSPG
jgi:hypothetical protein